MRLRGLFVWSASIATVALTSTLIGAVCARKNKKLNVFLDDQRDCPPGFELARSYDACIRLLKENRVNILSLDHDLGADRNGYDVAHWLVEHQRWPKVIYLHTSNPFGRRHMFQLLQRYKPEGVTVNNHAYPT